MGEVHIARGRSGRVVVIKKVRKTLSLDPALCNRLALEAQILRRIDHPNVVRVLDGGVSKAGQPFMVMARAFGTPLEAALAEGKPFSRDRIIAITSQLLEGLIAIHEAGVVHADLKTSNVLIDELDRVTIIDFGLARLAQAPATDDELFGGTPGYMAPELLAGGVPAVTTDVYAAGVIIYEMLTGSTPLPRGLPAVVMLSRSTLEPIELPSRRAPRRDITPALDNVVARAISIAPDERFASVRELADALAAALAAWVPVAEETPTGYWHRAPGPANLAPTLRRPVDTAPAAEADTEVEHIIQHGLGAASKRINARDLDGAISALEDALGRLEPGDPTIAITPNSWRLGTVLAALYASRGNTDQAHRLARRAHKHAGQSGNAEALARASDLLEKLAAAPKRIARGSRSVPVRANARARGR